MPQMTVLEILNRTKAFFEKKGVPDPLLDAQYIISHGLKMKNRMDLYLNFEKPLTPAELDILRPLVARRGNREPLQHIIGDTSFRGFVIKCDPRALIPRPETESLVDMAKDALKGIENPFVVEIGTGTGAISIARENAQANGLDDTLNFTKGDLLDAVTAEAIKKATGDVFGEASTKIDCLIANLPYIPDGEKGKLQPEVDKFDPALALYGGPDGLDLVRKLLSQTESRLNAGAPIFLEIGSEQADVLKNEAINYPWLEFTGAHKDYCDNIRFVSYKAK